MIAENVIETDGPSSAIPTPALAGQLGGQALYVLAGNIFTLVVGLPLQIYVSRKLGSAGLGTYSLLEGIAATGAGLLGLGLAQTAVRFIPQYLEEKNSRAITTLVTRGALALAALGILGSAIFFIGARWGNFGLSADPLVLALMGATIPLSLVGYFVQQSLRGFREIRYLITGTSFIQVSVKSAATIIFFALGARLAGYAAATVIALGCTLGWLTLALARRMRNLGDAHKGQSTGNWKRFAAINFASSLLSLPASYLDRFLLGFFAGASPVGVLAVTRQLQQLPAVLYQMLLSVAAPMFAGAHAKSAKSEQEHLYALTTDWAVKAALPLILFLALFAHPVLALFGPRFADAGTVPLQILMAAQLFNLASGPNGNMAMMSGLEREAFRIDVVTLGGTALLLLAVVPAFGLVGVAICGLANSLASNVATLFLVRKKLAIRWWNRRYLRWALPAAAATAIGASIAFSFVHFGAVLLAVVLAGMYAAFALCSLLQGLHKDDLELIAHVRARLAL